MKKYSLIIGAAQNSGYQLMTLNQWLSGDVVEKDVFLIRHDVDRHPERALDMAKLEASFNIRSSYYFRAVPCSFNPRIIESIANLGHEIGYHYEDWFLARYNKGRAIELYRKHLSDLRKIAPVSTIAMHGSPLAKESNLAIWDHYDLCGEDVKDVIQSSDFTNFAFFTDTGRTFGQSKANLRDFIGSETVFENVKTSNNLIAFLSSREHPQIYFSVHPERWTDHYLGWSRQYVKDNVVNAIKLGIRLVR